MNDVVLFFVAEAARKCEGVPSRKLGYQFLRSITVAKQDLKDEKAMTMVG